MGEAAEVSRLNLFHHREVAAWQSEPPTLPVTLVTGFLGAGKTALIGHLLRSAQNLRIAAAVNDAAAVNVGLGHIVALYYRSSTSY